MPIGVFLVVFFSFVGLAIVTVSGVAVSQKRTSGEYTQNQTQSLSAKQFTTIGNPPYNELYALREQCNTAAVRTCQSINQEMRIKYLAGDATCSGYQDVTVLWSFLGNTNTTGVIEDMYSNPISSTLDCSNPGEYGRYVFSKALPKHFVADKNISYNLNGIVPNVDPCGFSEIF